MIQAQISWEKEPFGQLTGFFCLQRAVGGLQPRVKESKSGSNGSTWCNWCNAIHRIVQYGAIQLPTWLAN